jgi:hypothetical protein
MPCTIAGRAPRVLGADLNCFESFDGTERSGARARARDRPCAVSPCPRRSSAARKPMPALALSATRGRAARRHDDAPHLPNRTCHDAFESDLAPIADVSRAPGMSQKCRFCCKSRRSEARAAEAISWRCSLPPAPLGSGGFDAVALTPATITRHTRRLLVVVGRLVWLAVAGSVQLQRA